MRRSMMCLALISLSMAVLLGPAGPAGAGGVETLNLDRYYYPIGTSENDGEQAVVFRTV